MKKSRFITMIFALLFGILALTACATAEAGITEPVAVATPEPTPEPTPTPDPCADCSSCNCDDADCCAPPCCDSPYCMPGCDKRTCCDDCLEAFRARSRERDERWAAEQQARQDALEAMSEEELLEYVIADTGITSLSVRGAELIRQGYFYAEGIGFFAERNIRSDVEDVIMWLHAGNLHLVRTNPDDYYCTDILIMRYYDLPYWLAGDMALVSLDGRVSMVWHRAWQAGDFRQATDRERELFAETGRIWG